MNLEELRKNSKLPRHLFLLSERLPIFSVFKPKESYFVHPSPHNNKLPGYSLFEINYNQITLKHNIFKKYSTPLVVGDKYYKVVEFLDFLFYQLSKKRQSELLDDYIRITHDEITCAYDFKHYLIDETIFHITNLVEPYIHFTKIKYLNDKCFDTEFTISFEDDIEFFSYNNKSGTLYNENRKVYFENAIFEKLEPLFHNINFNFPAMHIASSNPTINPIQKTIIQKLISREFKKTKEYKIRKIFEPNFFI